MFLSPKPRRGATLLDYGLIAVVLIVVVIGSVSRLGGIAASPFSEVNNALGPAGNGGAEAPASEAPAPTSTPEPTPAPTPTPEPVVDLAYVIQPVGIISSGWETTTYPPANAFDGNDSSGTFPNGDPGRTIELHFPRAIAAEGFRVLQGNQYEDSAQSYVIESSSNGGGSWTVRYTGGGVATDESGDFTSTVGARTWRLRIIQHSGPWGWALKTFELRGVNTPEQLPAGTDLAATLSPMVTGMDIWSGSPPLTNVRDGDDATHAAPNGNSGAGVQYDFGTPVTIDGWRVRQATVYNTSAQGYVIESSSDGSSWTTRASAGGIATIDSGTLASPVIARYWRIRITQHSGPWGWDLFTFGLYNSAQ